MLLILVLTFIFLGLAGAILYLFRKNRLSRHHLEKKIKQLSDELKASFEHLEEQRARLETTFSGMTEGVLVTDQRGEILHLNPAFKEMFGLKEKPEGRSALEVLANVPCDDAIQEVIQKGEPVEREITFEKPRQRVFQVHFSPMRRDQKLFGVVSVFHDLTEIRCLEEVRRDFVANLSHELKTPLTAIQGFSETLLEDSGGDEVRRRKHIEVIFRHATDLGHLMENLLNLSKIESGKEEIRTESIQLKPFVDHLLDRFSVRAEVRKIKIHNEVLKEAPPFQADPHKLNQILANLVDNAIKYTSEGGEIWIRTPSLNPLPLKGKREKGEGVKCTEYVIEVADNGPGIPQEDQSRIFERFYRVDKARSRETGGAGLGLAIVKHLVELHGGRVSVESKPGEGSRFKIYLPLAE